MSINFLSRDKYFSKGAEVAPSYWTPGYSAKKWRYHQQAIELLRSNKDDLSPSDVIEVGTMGVQIVEGSHTLDHPISRHSSFIGVNPSLVYPPTYSHDALKLPWPIPDKKYQVLVALRVLMHLSPLQEECFREFFRVSQAVLLVVAPHYPSPGRGVHYDEFVQWLDGIHPNYFCLTSQGALYYWDSLQPSYENALSLKQRIVMRASAAKLWLRRIPGALCINRIVGEFYGLARLLCRSSS